MEYVILLVVVAITTGYYTVKYFNGVIDANLRLADKKQEKTFKLMKELGYISDVYFEGLLKNLDTVHQIHDGDKAAVEHYIKINMVDLDEYIRDKINGIYVPENLNLTEKKHLVKWTAYLSTELTDVYSMVNRIVNATGNLLSSNVHLEPVYQTQRIIFDRSFIEVHKQILELKND